MGLLAKLFGTEAEKTISNIAENVVKETSNAVSQISEEVTNFSNSLNSSQNNAQAAPQSAPQAVPVAPASGTGCSWGDSMPLEPNQYNYSGNYEQYFESIFADKLSGFRMEKEEAKWSRTVYTFYGESGKALVVELLPETSVAKKLRNDCAAAQVPYLRFYYNHRGWWNTRSYVESRISGALK